MEESVELVIQPSYISQYYIGIRKKWWHIFPTITSDIELKAEPIGTIHSQFYVEEGKSHHHGISKNLKSWFTINNLKAGDKIKITLVTDMKKYHVEKL